MIEKETLRSVSQAWIAQIFERLMLEYLQNSCEDEVEREYEMAQVIIDEYLTDDWM